MQYSEIDSFGPYDFEGFYELIVAQAPTHSTIVEVGCFKGRSLCHLGKIARDADRGLRVVGVDWGGGMGLGSTLEELTANIDLCGLTDFIEIFVGDSAEKASDFRDEYCWLVFLDAAHTPHEAVARDIRAWMPKVQTNGFLAGHDYRWHTVCEPTNSLLDGVMHDPIWDNVWLAPKQKPWSGRDIHQPTTIPQSPDSPTISSFFESRKA